MGIWNTRRIAPGRRGPCAHYPSWGFGTLAALNGKEQKPATHYPSWGFGTRKLFSPVRINPILITPHGDLERAVRDLAAAIERSTHYPSWGFGTPSPRLWSVTGRRSLPLMGIWNRAQADMPRPGLPLITPHGDLERAPSAASSWPPIAAHYPSWGFGTCGPPPRTGRGSRPHYPSWGFGTLAGTEGSKYGAHELITPHGDLEPVAFTDGTRAF